MYLPELTALAEHLMTLEPWFSTAVFFAANAIMIWRLGILEEKGFEVAAFHGVGVGGRTFEEWVDTGMFAGVLDVTPHDINNFLFNGISAPWPDRLETAARKNIPQVVAPGGLDFISRGPIDTLSDEDRQKQPVPSGVETVVDAQAKKQE